MLEPAMDASLRAPTLVLGLGNLLLRDEGVGVHVVRALQAADLPAGVELCDGGTLGLGLLDALAERERVIVIDAIAGWPPGTVVRLTGEQLAPTADRKLSAHELGLYETLATARQLGIAPRAVVILGISPHDLRMGLELSPEVAALVPRLVELVRAELVGGGAEDRT
jgi:hydrogenase maturation protease